MAAAKKPLSKAQVAASALKVRRGQAKLSELPAHEQGPAKAMLRRGDRELRRHVQLSASSEAPREGKFVGHPTRLRRALGG